MIKFSKIFVIIFIFFTTFVNAGKLNATELNTAGIPIVISNVLYTGKIYHIFFHSLIVYPELAYNGNKYSASYKDYMITRDQFKKMLPELYKNNFVLIDIHSMYTVNVDGTVYRKQLFLPKGKKPLIISLDDLSYYHTMTGHGFANKLVLDNDGNVATQIINLEGTTEITRDGDVVPILDDFVRLHPDFSLGGAKGTIAITGFEGVLGYKTSNINSLTYASEVEGAKKVISKLKETGWNFASHSYSHKTQFVTGEITLDDLKIDTERWHQLVEPLVGKTDIFVGPFGQIFNKPGDERRTYLISQGFKMFCGVGMDLYLKYDTNSVTMDRGDIDGYRLTKTPWYLKIYFDPASINNTITNISEKNLE